MRRIALLLAVAVAACGGAGSATRTQGASRLHPPPLEADPAGKKAAGTVGFRWSDGEQICRIPARQEVEKKGNEATLTFTGVLVKIGGGWTFDMEQMTLVEAAGRAPTEAERKQVEALSIIPTTVLDDEGEFLEMRGMDELVDRLVAAHRIDADVAARMKTPAVQALMAQSAGNTWNTLFGAVLGVTLGEDFTLEQEAPMGASTVPVTVTFVDHGPVRGRPDLELLSVTQTIAMDTSSPAFKGLLVALGAPADQIPAMGSVRVETVVTVAIDPRSGRTHRARMEKVVALGDRMQREVRDTSFDWAKATGCGP